MNYLKDGTKIYYIITINGFKSQMEAAKAAVKIQEEFSIPDQLISITGNIGPAIQEIDGKSLDKVQ